MQSAAISDAEETWCHLVLLLELLVSGWAVLIELFFIHILSSLSAVAKSSGVHEAQVLVLWGFVVKTEVILPVDSLWRLICLRKLRQMDPNVMPSYLG